MDMAKVGGPFIGCESFRTNLNIPSPLPTTSVSCKFCPLLLYMEVSWTGGTKYHPYCVCFFHSMGKKMINPPNHHRRFFHHSRMGGLLLLCFNHMIKNHPFILGYISIEEGVMFYMFYTILGYFHYISIIKNIWIGYIHKWTLLLGPLWSPRGTGPSQRSPPWYAQWPGTKIMGPSTYHMALMKWGINNFHGLFKMKVDHVIPIHFLTFHQFPYLFFLSWWRFPWFIWQCWLDWHCCFKVYPIFIRILYMFNMF